MLCYLFLSFLVVMTITTSRCSECNKAENVTRIWKKLGSPNYPSKFLSPIKCTWTLYSPSGYRIKVQFTQFFMVEASTDGICQFQWLQIKDRKNTHFQCGRRSPGTLISSGTSMQLILRSTASANNHEYIGFEASYSLTTESPIFPVDTNKPKSHEIAEEKKKKVEKVVKTTLKNTLGEALDRLRPKHLPSSHSRMTQNERIEELNRRRNSGVDAPENPYFLSNGRQLETDIKRPKPSTPKATTVSILQNVPVKRRSSVSYEVKVVLVVISVCVAIFLFAFVANKFHIMSYVSKFVYHNHDNRSALESEAWQKNRTNNIISPHGSHKPISIPIPSEEEPKRHRHKCRKHREKQDLQLQNSKENQINGTEKQKVKSCDIGHKTRNNTDCRVVDKENDKRRERKNRERSYRNQAYSKMPEAYSVPTPATRAPRNNTKRYRKKQNQHRQTDSDTDTESD